MSPLPPPWMRWRAQPLAALPRLRRGLQVAGTCWSMATGGWFREHRLHLAPRLPCHTRFDLGPEALRQWHTLFDVPLPGDGPVVHPLLYGHRAATQLRREIFEQLGTDPRRCEHVRHRVRHPLGTVAYAATRQMQLQATVQHVFGVTDTTAFVVLQTAATNPDAQTVQIVDDGFLVSNLPCTDVARAAPNTRLARELLSMHEKSGSLPTTSPDALIRTLAFDAGLRRHHQQVSGAKDPFHAPKERSPFWRRGTARAVPRMALRDLIVRQLADARFPLDRLSIQFIRPAHPGQPLNLVMAAGRFELIRANGELVALGHVSD